MPETGWEERVARLEGRIDGFDGRFDRLERRIDALDAKTDGHFRWIVGLQVTVLVTLVGALLLR